jgi:hypothetical protein
VAKLLNITHTHSIYQSPRKHFHRKGGLRAAKNRSTVDRVGELIHSGLEELLSKHNHLIGEDSKDLGKGASVFQQYGVASMRS